MTARWRRDGLIGAAVGLVAAATGAVLVADHRVGAARERAGTELDRWAWTPGDRAGLLPAGDGVALHVEQDGPVDAPLTVVLVHGFCLDRTEFVLQRRAIRERYGDAVRIVTYDQRSHGRSGRSSSDHATIDRLGEDLLRVLDAIVPDGPVVLVGHSMGGMTIMALADAHPELFGSRVVAVALVSTATGKLAAISLGLPRGLVRLGRPAVPVLLRGARREARVVERGRARVTDVAWVFVKRLAFGPDVDPALVEVLARMIGATPVDVIADFYASLMSHDKLEALGVLRGLPVLLVCGELDLITPPDRTREMAEALPDARLVVVPAAGHQALMERPDVVNPPLLELIDRVRPAAGRRARARAAGRTR